MTHDEPRCALFSAWNGDPQLMQSSGTCMLTSCKNTELFDIRLQSFRSTRSPHRGLSAIFFTMAFSRSQRESSLTSKSAERLAREQLVQKMRDHFWVHWSQEYLQALHARSKWRDKTTNSNIGDLCLIRGELTAPGKWPLTRIIVIHSSEDGQVCVVSVKTTTSAFKRPIHKLLLLPKSDATNAEIDNSGL